MPVQNLRNAFFAFARFEPPDPFKTSVKACPYRTFCAILARDGGEVFARGVCHGSRFRDRTSQELAGIRAALAARRRGSSGGGSVYRGLPEGGSTGDRVYSHCPGSR